jgi:DNA-binding response OmpR family regulator
MMPVMDGMEMCRKIREDDRTSHIPVIILTAKADRGSKMEGLETGADDYIIKPFDAEELKVRVRNLIEQRKRLREKFRKDFSSFEGDVQAPYEELFLKKLMDSVQQHIADPEFNIYHLAEELNMSRTQVYRKVNALTDYTPKELIRNLRLKKAASLMRSGHKRIAQVMHKVGFNSQSHFSKCFSEFYGVTPTMYLKNRVR